MSTSDIFVRLAVHGVQSFTDALLDLQKHFDRLSTSLRFLFRTKRRRTGRRHRGTVAWRLRYASTNGLPLGQRMAAKRLSLRHAPDDD